MVLDRVLIAIEEKIEVKNSDGSLPESERLWDFLNMARIFSAESDLIPVISDHMDCNIPKLVSIVNRKDGGGPATKVPTTILSPSV